MRHVPRFRLIRIVLPLMAVLLLGTAPVFAQTSTPTAEAPFGIDPNAPCGESRLRVGDLARVDTTMASGIQRATDEAKAWRDDVQLYTLRLGCPVLTTGVKWEGTYFSASAQAFYATDTGKVEAVEEDPEQIPILDPTDYRMTLVHDALVAEGFSDDLLLTPQGGVTIRTNTDTLPWGPPTAPKNVAYAHMSIEQLDVIVDVWVSMVDGTVYVY